jgi:hypothetical protein
MSNKVTEDYPGKSLSIEELKAKVTAESNIESVKKSKFPTEIIDLPSKGRLYPPDSSLSSGRVEMKYMTAKEEDILTSSNLIQKGIVIDTLLRALIVSNGDGKSVNYGDLCIGDKNAIMVAARILGYGADYPVEMSCPSCQNKQKSSIDLASLENKVIDESLLDNGPIYDFYLPASKRDLTFKILTHNDEKKIEEEAKQMKKKNFGGNGVTYELTSRLKHMIQSVDGVEDSKAIKDFVENEFLSRDSLAFRKHIEAMSPDVDMGIFFECESCGHEEPSIQMPMNVQFFWPGA